MRYKSFFCFLSLLVLVTLVSACAAPWAPSDADVPAVPSVAVPTRHATAPAVTIGFAVDFSEEFQYAPLVERFNSENPDLRVRLITLPPAPFSELMPSTDTALVPARLLANLPRGAEAYVQDLLPFIAADPTFDRNDFYPISQIPSQTSPLYALPREVQLPLIFYNRALFAERGVPEPQTTWTWDDVLSAAEALAHTRSDGTQVYGFLGRNGMQQEVLASLLLAAGQQLPERDPPDPLNTDRATAVLERAAAAVKAGALYLRDEPFESSDPRFTQLIHNEQVAMWHASSYPNPTAKLDIGIAAYPRPTPLEADSTVFGQRAYVMSRGTAHPEAAWRWLSFISRQSLLSSDRGLQRVQGVPARISVAESSGYWTRIGDGWGDQLVADLKAVANRNDADVYHLPRWFAPMHTTLVQVAQDKAAASAAIATAQQAVQNERPAAAPVTTFSVSLLPERAPPPGAQIVTFATTRESLETSQRFAEAYAQEQPGVFVQVKPYSTEDGGVSFETLAASSDCFASTRWPNATTRPLLLDLQPLIDAMPNFALADYTDVTLQPFQFENRLYGLPHSVSYRMLYYRPTLFDAQNLPHPTAAWTLEDVKQVAQELTLKQEQQYGFSRPWYNPIDAAFFLNRAGVQVVTQQNGTAKPNFTNPAVVSALRFYLELLQTASPLQELLSSEVISNADADPLHQGRVAMWLDNARYTLDPSIEKSYAVVAPVLGQGMVTANDMQIGALYISAASPRSAECWGWLHYLSQQPRVSDAYDTFPARSPLVDAALKDGLYSQQAEQVYRDYQTALARQNNTVAPSVLRGPDFDPFWLYNALDRTMKGGNLEQELDRAQGLTEAYLACYQEQQQWLRCARQVDPTYAGDALLNDSR